MAGNTTYTVDFPPMAGLCRGAGEGGLAGVDGVGELDQQLAELGFDLRVAERAVGVEAFGGLGYR
jgi:hypothetical protein